MYVLKQRVPPASASIDEKRRAQKERAKEFGVEALEGAGESLSFPAGFPKKLSDYADQTNLKFPLKPDNRARNARARFKQFASTYKRTSSKRIVHTRIVERLLAIGAKPSLNEEDPLDKLLPKRLRDRMGKSRQRKSEDDMDRIPVAKVKLQDGEELGDFANKVMEAVAQNRQRTQRSVFLRGIFKGFVILKDYESGKFFQSKMTRDKDGVIKLGESFEVRQTFVPVASTVAKSETAQGVLIAIDGEVMRTHLTKAQVSELIAKPDADEEIMIVEVEKNAPEERVSFANIVG